MVVSITSQKSRETQEKPRRDCGTERRILFADLEDNGSTDPNRGGVRMEGRSCLRPRTESTSSGADDGEAESWVEEFDSDESDERRTLLEGVWERANIGSAGGADGQM